MPSDKPLVIHEDDAALIFTSSGRVYIALPRKESEPVGIHVCVAAAVFAYMMEHPDFADIALKEWEALKETEQESKDGLKCLTSFVQ